MKRINNPKTSGFRETPIKNYTMVARIFVFPFMQIVGVFDTVLSSISGIVL